MGMKAENDAFAILQIAMHPLDGICINIGRCHLHRRRKVDDGLPFRARLPDIIDCITHLKGKFKLGARVGLR